MKSNILKTMLSSVLVIGALSVAALAADVQVGTVSTDSTLNFRSSPSTSASIISSLPSGTRLAVLESSDGWHKIATNGQTGYVSAEYVTLSDTADFTVGTGVISGSVVNFRSSPSTSGAVLNQLPKGTSIQLTGVESGWFKGTYGGVSGYLHSDYVELSAASGGGENPVTGTSSGTASEVIAYAKQFLGTPYKAAGSSPKGFDCSGFTQYVFNHFGISLSRSSSAQVGDCVAVSKSDLQPGDLVFFLNPKSSKTKVGHVGIYIGDGNFIHSSSPGDVVKIDTLERGYYLKNYVSAGRVL